ncbi:SAF domain-containing protein [Knoellia aerolata]|uniref:Membrane protein n=1 Tax=Knoellia aerolata DSM 18566 TaxID=1385519 RepID=A0A0A0JZU1_9MICO|nr:SAF domain-containing protein [Knoellia aerolata]KGN41021.1 membrane protein [Knoellia aerolata DSM 18566]
MTTTTNHNGAKVNGVAASSAEADVRVAPAPKLRRRPALIAASVAAICLGGLVAAFAWTSTSNTQSVLAMRVAVERGALVSAQDVMSVQVSADPALHPIPASQSSAVVGQRAATDMAAGTLVTLEQVSDAVLPPAGMSIVGVGLPASQMPGEPLLVGDMVRVVATPGQSGEVIAGKQVTIAATVVGVRMNDENGQNVVSVQVAQQNAAELAARAATGNVALVLDSRER